MWEDIKEIVMDKTIFGFCIGLIIVMGLYFAF